MNNVVRLFILVVLICFMGSVATVFAKGPQNVGATAHNLSSIQTMGTFEFPYKSTNEDEVCIFCHTPHGGQLNSPLWNRELPAAGGFTHYSSTTLSPTVGATNRPVNDESLLCLGCHDGSIAVNRILNISNGTGAQPTTTFGDYPVQPGLFGAGPKIGATNADTSQTGMLTDDHPISFSYRDAWDYETNTSGENGLVDPTVILGMVEGPVFFGDQNPGNAGSLRVECSSCHDPHVYADDYVSIPAGYGNNTTFDTSYRPFLIMPNTGSQLCLACHIK